MRNPDITIVLGIRPDLIRASLVLKFLKANKNIKLRFVWSGQHYSENLKDIFFRELDIPTPDIEFEASGNNDAEIAGKIILELYKELTTNRPKAVVFLGDTNTVLGCIAAAQLNIPIIHIEGCMRSYDWRMPEEKCRTTIDHLSDVIYTYYPEYKLQGVVEGISPNRIVVIQNLIVDVMQNYYFPNLMRYKNMGKELSLRYDLGEEFFLATSHRRENVEDIDSMKSILNLYEKLQKKVIFPASYRTQKSINRFGLILPNNVKMIDPIGYFEMLALMSTSIGVATDSGTVVEETAVMGIPSIQMRKSTERPQTYDCKSSVKFDPLLDSTEEVLRKFETIRGTSWKHGLGDGRSSKRLVDDLIYRVESSGFDTHKPNDYHIPIDRSYQGDNL